MRSYLLTAAVACLTATTGCNKSPDFGQAIAVTIHASELTAASRATVRTLAIIASGAESYSGSLPTPNGIAATERTVYRPNASTGDLRMSVTALDGSGGAVAYGVATASLAAGKTVELTILLSTEIPAFDMAQADDLAGRDMAVADDLSAMDAAVAVDFAAPPDLLPIIVTPAAVWKSSGGGAGAAASGATLSLSIGGTVVGSATATSSSGATLSFGKLGTAR